MGMNDAVKIPDLSSKLEAMIISAVDDAIRKAESKVKGRTITVGDTRISLGIEDQKLLDSLDRSKKKIEEKKKEIKNLLEDVYSYKPSANRGIKLSSEQTEQIKSRIDGMKNLTKAQATEMKKQLESEAKLVNSKNKLLEQIKAQKELEKQGTLNIKEVEKYYQNVVKLQGIIKQLHDLQKSTKSTGTMATGFDVSKLIGEFKGGKLESLFAQAYDNEIKNLESQAEQVYIKAQQGLVKTIVKDNPLSKTMDSIHESEKQITQSYDNIKNESKRLISELGKAWEIYNSDEATATQQDAQMKNIVKLISTLERYKDTLKECGIELHNISNIDDIMDEYNMSLTPPRKNAPDSQKAKYNELLEISKNSSSRIIENNNSIIKSNREAVESQKQYITNMDWVKDSSVRAAFGDDVLSVMSSQFKSLQEENERLKQSLESKISTEQFDALKSQLEESQTLVSGLQEKIETLKTSLSEQKKIAEQGVVGAGGGAGSGDGIGSGNSEGIDKVNQKIKELESKILELRQQMDSLKSGEGFEVLTTKIKSLETELDTLKHNAQESKLALDFGKEFDTEGFKTNFSLLKELLVQISSMSKDKTLSGIVSDADVSRFVSLSTSISEISRDLIKIDFTKLDVSSLNPDNTSIFNSIVNNFKVSLESLVTAINTELDKIKIEPHINKESFLTQINGIVTEINKTPIEIAINDIHLSNVLTRLKAHLSNIADGKVIDVWQKQFISAIDEIVAKIDRSFLNLERSSARNMIQRWQDEQKILNGVRTSYVTTKDKDGNEIVKKGGYGSLERKAFMNTKTGYITSDVYDQADHVSQEISFKLLQNATEKVNAMLHSHPSGSAAFSPEDVKAISSVISKGITESYVVGAQKIAKIDLSGVTESDIKKIAEEYRNIRNTSAFKESTKAFNRGEISLDDYNKKAQDALAQSINTILKDGSGASRVQTLNLDDFNTHMKSLENARNESQQLYNVVQQLDGLLKGLGQNGNMQDVLKVGNLENAIKYLQENLGLQIPQAAQQAKVAIDGIGEQVNQEGQEASQVQIPVKLSADIESLNASIQSQKEQIIPIDVKLNTTLPTIADNSSTGISQEVLQSEELRKKLAEVKQAIDDKTNAFKTELQVVQLSVPQEISALEELSKYLLTVLKLLEKIQQTPVKLDINASESFVNSESNVNELIKEIKNSLDGLNSDVLKNLNNVLQALNVKESVATNVQRLADAILNLKSNLNDISPNSADFLNSIKELISQADKLKDLATVISATKDKIKQAKDEVAKSNVDTEKTFDVKIGTREWDLVLQEALKYKDVLGDIQKITYSMRRDKDNKELKSYKITGSKSSATIGENGKLVAEKEVHEYTKTAEELMKIRNDFISAANKGSISFNLDSLKVDTHGIITFTSTIEKAGEEAVTTKYKIEDLYSAINNGALSSEYLNKHVYGNVSSKDLADEESKKSYAKEIELRKQANKLKIENISANKSDKAYNDNIIKSLEKEIKLEQEKRIAKGLDIEERNNNLLEIRKGLLQDLAKAQHEYNSKLDEKNAKEQEKNNKLSAYTLSDINDVKDSFKGITLGDSNSIYGSSKLDTSGKGTLTFIEEVGDVAKITTIYVNDLADALVRISNGKFDYKGLKASQSEQDLSVQHQREREKADKKRQEEIDNLRKQSEKNLKDKSDSREKDINDLLKEQKSEYEAIYKARLNIANLDKNSADYEVSKSRLTEEVRAHQRSYLTIQKKLNSYGEIEQRQKHVNELLKIGQTYQNKLFDARKSKMTSNLEEQVKAQNKIYDLESKIATTTKSSTIAGYKSDLDAENKKLKLLQEESVQYNDILSKEEQEAYIVEKTKDALIRKNEVINSNANSNTITDPVKLKEAEKIIQNTNSNLAKLFKPDVKGFENAFNRAKVKVEDLNSTLLSGKITDVQTGYTDKINKIFKDLNNVIGVTNPLGEDPNAIEDAKRQMLEYTKQLSNGKVVVGDFNAKNGKMIVAFEEQKGVLREVELKWNDVTGAITATPGKIKKAQSNMSKFLDGLNKRFASLAQYLLTFVSFYRIWGTIKSGIQVIRDLDTALTEMRKVSDETVESLKNFQDVSFDIAGSIGSTAKQIQNSAADFLRLGYSLKEASELAKDANIYANVGDMEIDTATEHMISSIKAWESEFSSEVEASAAIVDRYNEIGNNFAISSADIGSAMERSAAALKAGGNTLNEALGLIVAGNVIQQDAETTAAALKIMSLRIRGSKTELEEMGESTDGLASSTSKLRAEIKALSGVDIMKDEKTYKSTAEIIKELGEVYNKMTDVSQANLLEKLAGKNRASTVEGLLQNYEVIDEVMQSAENAEGSAIKENLRYMESIEGKVAKFTNEVQEFWSNLIDSKTVKGFVDFGTTVIDVLGEIVDKLGLLGSVGAGIGVAYGISSLKNSGGRTKTFVLIAKICHRIV